MLPITLLKHGSGIFLVFLYLLFEMNITNGADTITYMSLERPLVEEYNKNYLAYINMTTFRYGRMNQVYYMNMFFDLAIPFDNKVQLSFYFYEFLSNRYQRSFVEMHFKWCNLIQNDLLFGSAMKQGKLASPCPHMPGPYELYNMTILPDAIPRGFPFTKGRIICNLTYLPNKDFISWGHVDMELKTLKVKTRNPKTKL